MNTLKELVNKVYNDLQESDWINEYPELNDRSVVANSIEDIALDTMPDFVEKSKLKDFVDESEKNYKEETFKKYVSTYSDFLENVENEFYNSLLMWLTEE